MKEQLVAVHRDERGFVLGAIIRIAIVLVVVSLAIHEVGEVMVAKVRAENAAGAAAQAAANTYYATKSPIRADLAAKDAARGSDGEAQVLAVIIDRNGVAWVTVREVASTYVVHRLSFLRDFATQDATQEASHSF
jgi:Flp pilus assembly protein TadG